MKQRGVDFGVKEKEIYPSLVCLHKIFPNVATMRVASLEG